MSQPVISTRINKIDENEGKTAFHLNKQYRIAVLEGGGAKGLAYPGAVDALEAKGILDTIDCFAGSSAGAITAAVCALGYRGKDLRKVVDSIDANTLLDRQMLSTGGKIAALFTGILGRTNTRGEIEGERYLNTGNNLLSTSRRVIKQRFVDCYNGANDEQKKKMEELGIRQHMDNNRITFADFAHMKDIFPEHNFKDLVITSTQLAGHSGFIVGQNYFNAQDTPHAEVAYAARMSASIPYIYKRKKYLGQYYTDGGVTANLPLNFFFIRNEYQGDILALVFDREQKNLKNPEIDMRKYVMCKLTGDQINAKDWAEASYAAGLRKAQSGERGVHVGTVKQGPRLDTLTFSESQEVIDAAREESRISLERELQVPKTKSDFNNYSLKQLKEWQEKINSEKNIAFYIEGNEITSDVHRKNLVLEIKNEIDTRISILDNTYKVKTYEEKEKERKLNQQKLFDDLNENNFNWLYAEIEVLQKEKYADNYINEWLADIKKFATPSDIVLSRGIVLLDNSILTNKAKVAQENELTLIREDYEKSIEILNTLSAKIAEKYHFHNIAQLRDAMGEYARLNHIEEHKKYFEAQRPESIHDVIASPYVIKDILGIDRMNDLDFIQYLGDTTIRGQLAAMLENEIKKGDSKWLADLLIYKKLYDYYHDKNNDEALKETKARIARTNAYRNMDPFSAYVYDAYAIKYGKYSTNDVTWHAHYSPIIRLVTNSKLANQDSREGNYSGYINMIMNGLAEDVIAYFNSLKHDLSNADFDLAVLDLPTFEFKENVKLEKANYGMLVKKDVLLRERNAGEIMDPGFRKIDLSDFDHRIYTEDESPFTSFRKDKLIELCTYINNNSYTWYNDLFGMNSILEFGENPLLVLLSSEKLGRERSIGIISRLEELHGKQSGLDEVRTSVHKQRENRLSAERKVAEGVGKIYEQSLKNIQYDRQGIAKIEISGEEIRANNWEIYFPDNMPNGVTVHVLRDAKAKEMLPVKTLVEGKVKSLCKGAQKFANTEGVEETLIKYVNDIVSKSDLQAMSKKELKDLLNNTITLTLKTLFRLKNKDNEDKFKQFCKSVIKESTHHRVSDSDILVFDLGKKTFSYDHLVPGATTAHDRELGNNVANHGISFDGRILEKNESREKDIFKVTSSVVHHSSLAPLPKKRSDHSDLEMLIDTCNHIEEVALNLAKLQIHGAGHINVVDVNWCYQLLTTNAFNLDDQYYSFRTIAKATGLMDDSSFLHEDVNIHLNMSLLNCGINQLSAADLPIIQIERTRQNRKAWLYLTKSLREMKVPDRFAKDRSLNDNIKAIKDVVAPKISESDEYQNLQLRIKENADQFNAKRKIYNAIIDLDTLRSGKNIQGLITKYKAVNKNDLEDKLYNIVGTDTNRHILEKEIKNCISTSENLNAKLKDEVKTMKSEAKDARTYVNKDALNAYLTQISIQCNKDDEEEVIYVASLIYKSYMDELYYSEKYLDREYASLFNAYVAAYQRLTGMMATTGCKSANDRAYVIRLALAAIEGRRDSLTLQAPVDYLNNKTEYKLLKNSFADMEFSNSCFYSTVNDTTATSKVDVNTYPILVHEETEQKVKDGFNMLKEFGNYASHMMNLDEVIVEVDEDVIDNVVQEVNAAVQKQKILPPVEASGSGTPVSSDTEKSENIPTKEPDLSDTDTIQEMMNSADKSDEEKAAVLDFIVAQNTRIDRFLARAILLSQYDNMKAVLEYEKNKHEEMDYSLLLLQFQALKDNLKNNKEISTLVMHVQPESQDSPVNQKFYEQIALKNVTPSVLKQIERLKELGDEIINIEITVDKEISHQAIKRVGENNYNKLKEMYSAWLSLPSMADMGNMGRGIYGFYENDKLNDKDIQNIAVISSNINNIITKQDINTQEDFNARLNNLAFVKSHLEKSIDNPIFAAQAKQGLLYKVLNGVEHDRHWFTEDEIKKVIASFNSNERIYSTSLNKEYFTNKLIEAKEDAVKNNKKQFPVYFILNDLEVVQTDNTNQSAGSHWACMKLDMLEDNTVTYEYVDSMGKPCPALVINILEKVHKKVKESDDRNISVVIQEQGHECGPLTMHHVSQWLGNTTLPFDRTNPYGQAINKLVKTTQTIVLELTTGSIEEKRDYPEAFEKEGYKLKPEVIANSWSNKSYRRPETSRSTSPSSSSSEIKPGSTVQVQTEQSTDVAEEVQRPNRIEHTFINDQFFPVKKMSETSREQLAREIRYLDRLITNFDSDDYINKALKDRGTKSGIDNLTDLDNALENGNIAKGDTSFNANAPRASEDSLRNSWKIMNNNPSWESTNRDRFILEALIGTTNADCQVAEATAEVSELTGEEADELNVLIRKSKQISLNPDEENVKLTDYEKSRYDELLLKQQKLDKLRDSTINVTQMCNAAAYAVNQHLAPYISKRGFLEPYTEAGVIKRQEDFRQHLRNIRKKYQTQADLFDSLKFLEIQKQFNVDMETNILRVERFEDIKHTRKINPKPALMHRFITPKTEEVSFEEEAIRGKLMDTKHQALNYMLVRKKRTAGSNMRDWILYHLNEKMELVAKNVADDPGLINVNEYINNQYYKDLIVNDVANKNKKEIADMIAAYFMNRACVKSLDDANYHHPIQKLHISEWDANSDAKRHAREICDNIKIRLKKGQKVGLFYHANSNEAQQLYASYMNMNISLPKIFSGDSYQKKLFREIGDFIEKNHYRDQVHILPLPKSSDNKLNPAIENLAMHMANDFKVLGIATDNNHFSETAPINRVIEIMQQEPISKWAHNVTDAYDHPKPLTMFSRPLAKNIYNSLSTIALHPGNLVIKEILTELKQINKREPELLWRNVVAICKKHEKSDFVKNNKQLALLVNAISEFDANLAIWPDIQTVNELVFAQQKRNFIKTYIHAERVRLKDIAFKEGKSEALAMKDVAYQTLTKVIRLSNKSETLNEIIEPNSKEMLTRLPGEGHAFPLPTANIQSALAHIRGRGKDVTSQIKLDKLRDSIINPHKVIGSLQYSIQKEADEDTPESLLKSLEKMKTIYTVNLKREDHVKDIEDLITSVMDMKQEIDPRVTMEKILARVRRELVKVENKQSIGFYLSRTGYHYPRLLKEFLDLYKEYDKVAQRGHVRPHGKWK